MLGKIRDFILAPHPRPFLGELKRVRFWIVMLLLFFLADFVSHFWVFEYASLWHEERLQAIKGAIPPTQTVFVRITRREYERYFAGQSPLNPTVLQAAVCSILKRGPKVLVLDIATSSARFADPKLFSLPKTHIPIVLPYDAYYLYQEPREGEFKKPRKIVLQLGPVLGGLQNVPATVRKALPVAPEADDWSVRTYSRCFYLEGRGQFATLSYAGVRAFRGDIGDGCDSTDGIPKPLETGSIASYYDFGRVSLEDLLGDSPALPEAELRACLAGTGDYAAHGSETNRAAEANKVVVLGGEYSGYDWHPTPFGLKPGAELVASAIEEQLRPDSGNALEEVQKYGIKFILALVLTFIHCRLRPFPALLASLFGLGTLVLFGNLIAFYFAGYRASTVLFLMGILIEQLLTSAEDHS